MSNFHICTTDSLRAGIPQVAHKCPVCEQKTLFDDWCGSTCDTCGLDTCWEGDWGGAMRGIRAKSGLSRKDLAEASGLKPATIKWYEWHQPSTKYWHWFRGYIKEFYQEAI